MAGSDESGHGGQSGQEQAPDLDLDKLAKAIGRRSFCTLATVSPADRPHDAGVLYAAVGTTLFVSTLRGSRKARNVVSNPYVGVVIPIRRLPLGPPSTVQFQAKAEVLDVDDPRITELVDAGELKSITSHGELELPDGCVLRIEPLRRITTYGLGMSLWQFLRDPLNAGGHIDLPA